MSLQILSNEIIAKIAELHVSGLALNEIATDLGISALTVRNALNTYRGIDDTDTILQSAINNSYFEMNYISRYWNLKQRIEIANNLCISEVKVERTAFRIGLPKKKRVLSSDCNLSRARKIITSDGRVFLSLRKCAKELGKSPTWILKLIKAGAGLSYYS